MDSDDRAELLAANPDIYYVTDHYVGNAVLVRLSRVNPERTYKIGTGSFTIRVVNVGGYYKHYVLHTN